MPDDLPPDLATLKVHAERLVIVLSEPVASLSLSGALLDHVMAELVGCVPEDVLRAELARRQAEESPSSVRSHPETSL